jgi:phosphoribosylformylglycinamidine cyclo-ligase
VASRLERGYATEMPGGVGFGDVLLEPTVMYVPLIAALLARSIPVSYLSHITGHGLLKLMRAQRELTYRIERLPAVPPVLEFLVEQSGLDPAGAYSTFNMGAGFAVYCAAGSGETVVAIAAELGLAALLAGRVEDGPRRVLLDPVGVSFDGERLELAVKQ